MTTLTVHTRALPAVSRVFVGSGVVQKASDYLAPMVKGRKIALITDTRVWTLHGALLDNSLDIPGFRVNVFQIPEGEESKSLSRVHELAGRLAERRFERGDAILALGGGVILDLAGFLASIYMRGILYASIPTTLLSQADVCIGGKVAVNHQGGRNLLGSFHHADLVLVDPDFLHTLDDRDIRSGLAEVVKAAIIGDEALFRRFEEKAEVFRESWNSHAEEMITQALKVKLTIVEQDEREEGPRMTLNLGHTVGHALETATDYKLLRHGESVAVGILTASLISRRRGILSPESFGRVEKVVTRFLPENQWKAVTNKAVLDAMELDKKKRAGRVPFVLPKQIGEVVILSDVDQREIEEALEEARDYGPEDI